MPWYYAGPDAKPTGPVTLDELHACRVSGIVTPETYVIEHTGQPTADWTWKRYKEVFPSSGNLPPIPPLPLPPLPTSLPPPPAPGQPSVFQPGVRPDPYYNIKPTNGWCGWGFGLGLAAFLLSFVCVGFLPALLALPVCIVGLVQVQKNRNQSGRGLAVAGLILAIIALFISVAIASAVMKFKMHGFTVTEQSSSDSE